MEFLVGIFEVLDTLLTLNVCFFMIRAEGILVCVSIEVDRVYHKLKLRENSL